MDATAMAGVTTAYWATGATIADVNGDGWLDIYVCFSAYHTPARRTNKLFRNNGNRTFTDVTKTAGIWAEGYGLGLVVSDVNRDGWPDLYVANDFIYDDNLYLNNRDGTFSDRAGRTSGTPAALPWAPTWPTSTTTGG